MKRITSYNLNGIRAALGKGFMDWLAEADPDIVLIQETKAQPDQIPALEFTELGYHSFWHSAVKKGYSGVGILTKTEPDKVVVGMGVPKYDNEGRFLRADYGDISVVSVYHPSGSSGEDRQAFKMVWLDDFLAYVEELRKERPNLIIGGDYNICHKPIDIHDPVGNAKNSGFLPEEREWLSKFLDHGYIDSFRQFNQNPHMYSWWSFRANARANNKGWRIDYNMVTDNLAGKLKGADILMDVVHSDHCPVVLDIDF